MNRRQIGLIALYVALFSQTAFAKAYYAGKTEMIRTAEAIVVVNITKTESVEKQGNLRTYSQRAIGKVERTLKGNLTGAIEIFGMEDFICAQCEYKTGRFLLFLRRGAEDFWHGSNWDLGIRAITDDKVDWFKDDKSLFDTTPQPLQDVVKEIESAQKGKAPTKPSAATP